MRIQVDYNELRISAGLLKQKASNYEQAITRISAAVNDLSGVWQGSDSAALIAQMEAVRPMLMQMREVTESYSRMLEQSAAAYQNLQENRAACARQL
ncbi:WXG100 family type VII secretion target [Ileibacterium valens]|uniref:ESAT-6-like protein n=1 Tax=Ileibacterium valens TaxID=1862668 RepID=A0A1U7NFP7_9FIRM|nr:WXG100 family type VII secretion target [Ileibacterium valens]OLU39281.1 hypothetical protein BO222_06890 [Ileibacterium valens]OLU39422.1 hypothetical protein BO224_07395 [Erysipelotrichaceae bacterium NYU-BL-E8]OLU42544.1 hypothetical protein BM735_02055 [Erysipelotrichaceae bacterium NYU-BL-F16]